MSNPAFTKLTTITVVAEEDWIRAVINTPVKTPVTRLVVIAESISVIMGANIGTTVTAWIISIFGFKVDMAAFALPLLAIALPLIFSGGGLYNHRQYSTDE